MTTQLSIGDRAPAFTLLNQHGAKEQLTAHKGERVFLFFYPKAMTPG